MAPFPTTFELKCAGCAFIVSQILMGIAWALHSIDYDSYDVHDEAAVIELHNVLSSDVHRAEIEAACACFWAAFPFLLISLYGIKKFMFCLFEGTGAEMIVYVAEKAYLIFIAVVCVLLPALSLVSVSYEFSFHEYTPDSDFTPTGYYIQLYVITFLMELGDCTAVADATFLIALACLPRYVLLHSSAKTGDSKFAKFRAIMAPECCKKTGAGARCCGEVVTLCWIVTLLVIFMIVLFEFAEYGFFSPTGYAKFLVLWSFVLKLLLGIRFLHIGFSSKYHELKKVFDEHDGHKHAMLPRGRGSNSAERQYHMDAIHKTTDTQHDQTAHHDDDDDKL
mmetsp:Transcript_73330/g.116880  ORF Transcript_73330/g.116880 Transcript_73330/m.116880 type:complete len:336 (+) Transcript_73330:37-1044(+)|eukprot:CAMPEP_0197042170 /NCGR_PEP_ID=MMETSP1384-20130603/18588_1 /TAXON_ID=29189 /ORGANISM="Ammonia sp." /LENGTH=335 /DNA_ID=CAMNT_0042473225 /DNA_START=24 /DNA_END=1031 /DNA_ORIENTATION=-